MGDIPDTGIFRPIERPATMDLCDFTNSNVEWVMECKRRVERMALASPAMAAATWEKTAAELATGLVQGPFTIHQLDEDSREGFPALGRGRWHPLPRFGIEQNGKWRCVDDGKVAGTNANGISTHETITCDRPDTPARIGLRFYVLGRPKRHRKNYRAVRVGGGKDDAWAAYRRVNTEDPGYMVAMVAVPRHGLSPDSEPCVRCVRIPGHAFGITSGVLNFNVIPAPFVAFSRVVFGVPVSNFYDDHQVTEPDYADGSGQRCHFGLHEIARFHFAFPKHEGWSEVLEYTGVETDFRRAADGFITIGASSKRRSKLLDLISSALRVGSLAPSEASSMYGKARYALCPVFGRAGMAAARLLRKRQYEDESSVIDDDLRDCLELLLEVVRLLPAYRIPIFPSSRKPVVILTDASFESSHTWLGFVCYCEDWGFRWAGLETPQWLLDVWERTKHREQPIGQLEGIMGTSPYFSLPAEMLQGRNVMHYVDNQGALYGLIGGRSKDPDLNRICMIAQMRTSLLACNVWYDYVPSAANIADLPTRLDAEALLRLERLGPRVPLLLPPAWCLTCRWAALRDLFCQSVSVV